MLFVTIILLIINQICKNIATYFKELNFGIFVSTFKRVKSKFLLMGKFLSLLTLISLTVYHTVFV